jgi:hypothetical protein
MTISRLHPFRVAVAACASAGLLAAPASAQTEAALKAYFEGHQVAARIDMPGTQDGIDVRVNGPTALDLNRYRDSLKRYGTAVHAGEPVLVTLVKVKKDLIEFQLAGGGFGTFGDDTSTSANIPFVEKSDREKYLEKRVHDEDDRDKRRELQHELDDLRNRRERENRRITAERARIEEMKRARVAEERLRGGSRFNLRFADRVPVEFGPEDVIAVLAEYVNFRPEDARPSPPVPMGAPLPRPVAPPPAAPMPASGDISQLRKGMSRAEAERAFGRPVESSQRRDGDLVVTTLIFYSGDQRIAGDFVEDVLVRYTVSSR